MKKNFSTIDIELIIFDLGFLKNRRINNTFFIS